MRSATTRGLPIVVLLAVLGALAAATPSNALVVGIADQQVASFHDTRLTALPVRHARLSVAWDALDYRWQRRELDAWMRATTAAKMTVVVTFGRSRTRPFSLPPPAEYHRRARAFMRRYRHVREYSPWNEPNLAVQPQNYNPRRIAAYYRSLRTLCPRCKVLGADVVDNSRLGRWMRAYLRVFAPGKAPRLWGLHNYVDVNSTSRWGTETMLRLAPGFVWFTETGAIISRAKPTKVDRTDRRLRIRTGPKRAVAATKRVFELAATSPRVSRVYIYHWRASRKTSWDSALVTAKGTLRPSFDVFASQARRAHERATEVRGCVDLATADVARSAHPRLRHSRSRARGTSPGRSGASGGSSTVTRASSRRTARSGGRGAPGAASPRAAGGRSSYAVSAWSGSTTSASGIAVRRARGCAGATDVGASDQATSRCCPRSRRAPGGATGAARGTVRWRARPDAPAGRHTRAGPRR